jgi:hypothetical protein
MKFLEFQNALKSYTVFSLTEIRKLAPRFYRTRLSEWQRKGYLQKVVKGQYTFSDLELGEETLFEIANRIYPPSYISFRARLLRLDSGIGLRHHLSFHSANLPISHTHCRVHLSKSKGGALFRLRTYGTQREIHPNRGS